MVRSERLGRYVRDQAQRSLRCLHQKYHKYSIPTNLTSSYSHIDHISLDPEHDLALSHLGITFPSISTYHTNLCYCSGMARTRNWDPRVAAEVFVRLDHGQPIAQIARRVGLSYQQVQHFQQEAQKDTTKMPHNQRGYDVDRIPELHASVKAELDLVASAASIGGARIRGAVASPEQIDAEVCGCIDLVRQSAAELGISTRRFLHLALTHARSV